MKIKTDTKDILKGDKIRWENDEAPVIKALEFTAPYDGYFYPSEGTHYRTSERPLVVMPTEPTWGWATWLPGRRDSLAPVAKGGTAVFGEWCVMDSATGRMGFKTRAMGFWSIPARRITAFVPATAVPTEALDYLRAQWRGVSGTVAVFIADVDAANGPRL